MPQPGMTRAQLAERVGVNPSTINTLERRQPRDAVAIAFEYPPGATPLDADGAVAALEFPQYANMLAI